MEQACSIPPRPAGPPRSPRRGGFETSPHCTADQDGIGVVEPPGGPVRGRILACFLPDTHPNPLPKPRGRGGAAWGGGWGGFPGGETGQNPAPDRPPGSFNNAQIYRLIGGFQTQSEGFRCELCGGKLEFVGRILGASETLPRAPPVSTHPPAPPTGTLTADAKWYRG